MESLRLAYIGTTEYIKVYEYINKKTNITYFRYNYKTKGRHRCTINSGLYTDARECAIALDKHLLNKGLEPINILKKK